MGSIAQTMDLSHHINAKSKARQPSALKHMFSLLGKEGMISLAGGLPHPSVFPFKNITFTASTPSGPHGPTTEISISEDSQVPLSQWLQYGSGSSNPHLRQWCYEFTKEVHQPAYAEFQILCNPGNTNAWSKVVGLLLEDGEHVLCESSTYPSAQQCWIPSRNLAAPIALDDQGMRVDVLEDTLANWETTHPGTRRPHVMYVVPVGSNPTGVTFSAKRKQAIYDVCVKYDVIIVEDDPYFWLQYPSTGPIGESSPAILSNEDFVASISPSFLRYDYQGRVIRLESFAKTVAPGLRLGFFVANPLFTERLLRASEVDTQDPSGISQAFLLSLLQSWGLDGYLRWMQTVRCDYQTRRDWMTAAFASEFELVPAADCAGVPAGEQGVVALLKGVDGVKVPVFSFVPPTSGMFVWAKFYLAGNPNFQQLLATGDSLDPESFFGLELWQQLADDLVLLTPGSLFYPWQGNAKMTTKARPGEANVTHFRISFSYETKADMEEGIKRLTNVIRKSWDI